MLAAFLGFELIRRVSPLLHTPLMSLTNAISAIAVVGAILITGAKDASHAQPGAGIHRRGRVHHQPGQRLSDHRPHAEDVQEAGAGQEMMRTVLSVLYLLAAAGFILALKWMNSPATARRGVMAGEIGMLLAVVGTLLRHEVVNYEWILIAFFRRLGDRRSARLPDADDRGAAADGVLARLRRAGIGADRHGRILPRIRRTVSRWRARARDAAWLSDVHRQPDGVWKAAGNSADAADHLSRARTSSIWACSAGGGHRDRADRLTRADAGCFRFSRSCRCCSACC